MDVRQTALRRAMPRRLVTEGNCQDEENYVECGQCQAINAHAINVAVDFAANFTWPWLVAGVDLMNRIYVRERVYRLEDGDE
jgi:hypothetical protein